MNVAVNTRWLIPDKLHGFGWYSYHVLKRVTHNMPEVQFHFFYDRKIDSPLLEGLNITNHVLPPPARLPFLWTIWNNFSVPIMLKKVKAKVYFSPDGFLPARGKLPMLTTIHDLNFEEEESYVTSKVKRYYKKHFRAAANKAAHIFTVSEFSKKDICQRYGIIAQKVDFAHNGPQQHFEDLHNEAQSTRQRFARTHPYFLFVGAQNPRKNIHRIFQAFEAFCNQTDNDYQLLLVGERMLWDAEIEAVWKNMKHQNRVIFTGRLSTRELNKVYSAATALLFPSLFEGFGMPIIEAFQAGTPVITSLSTAMPEVGGEAALFVDPTRYEEITKHMVNLIENESLAAALKAKGFERAKLFTWEESAGQVEAQIRKHLNA